MYPMVNIILLQQLFSLPGYLACSLGFYFVVGHFFYSYIVSFVFQYVEHTHT